MTTLGRRSVITVCAAALSALVPFFSLSAEVGEQGGNLQFELYRDSRSRFRWRLKAANGRILGTSSEGYNAKADCRAAINRIREGASTASVEDLS